MVVESPFSYYNFIIMDLNLEKEAGLIEAVLFLESEPLTVDAIANITQLSGDVVTECLEVLKSK